MLVGVLHQVQQCNVVSVGDLYTEAAERATAAMKGRIASQYYALAEQAYSQVDDD